MNAYRDDTTFVAILLFLRLSVGLLCIPKDFIKSNDYMLKILK